MTTITTRAAKGSPLEWAEVDANFVNLNQDKAEVSAVATAAQGALANTAVQPGDLSPVATSGLYSDLTGQPALFDPSVPGPIGATTPAAGTFTTLTSNGVTTFTNGTAIFSIDDGGGSSQQFRLIGPTSILGRNRLFSPAQLRISAGSANAIQFHTAAGTSVNSDGNAQFVISNTFSAVNYVQVTGAATTVAPAISAQGSDTNINLNVLSKGSGYIGFTTNSTSNQVRILHTANANYWTLTGSAAGNGALMGVNGGDTNISQVFQSKGTGAIDLAAGSSGVNISNGGTVTAITRTAGGTSYATAPTVTISAPTTAGGVQATATCTVTAGVVDTTFTITNAGSGYVEQPTVSFSGGGGSGAAAYATVGSGTVVKSIGSTLSFSLPSTELLRLTDSGTQTTAYWSVFQGSNTPVLRGIGTSQVVFESNSAVPLLFRTSSGTEQLRVAHTSSAVNYVQVTGAATGSGPQITAQGSDTNIQMIYASKGGFGHLFKTSGNTNQFSIAHVASTANFPEVVGSIAGSAPIFRVAGSDTNIDLALTPKGTGNVTFGTYTAGVLAPTGYITIKDSGGTVRRLLVG